ncbi:MAG: hypothetical protein ACFFFB_10650 [Candidatus Heimdallarchaeota archaeon]
MSYQKSETSKIIENNNSNVSSSISEFVIPYSKIIRNPITRYIYSGNENIPFKNKNPIFKSLMKIEFETAMRDYLKSLK